VRRQLRDPEPFGTRPDRDDGGPRVDELDVRDMTVRFGHGASAMLAVDGASLQIPRGKVLGLVGESGSGKSTLGRAIVGLVPLAGGVVRHRGRLLRNGRPAGERARRPVQMIFQDPYGSLNPRMSVGAAIGEAVQAQGGVPRNRRAARIAELLDLVSLGSGYAERMPREMSGGQRQRVAIARALAANPDVLVADEITSALDVSVQGTILNLIQEVRRQLDLTILFISHNLSVVRYVSDDVAVMYLGRIVETCPADLLNTHAVHPYTRLLLEAVPTVAGSTEPEAAPAEDDPPDPHHPPAGCHFHPRCPIGPLNRPDREICKTTDPRLGTSGRLNNAACHFADAAIRSDTRPAASTATSPVK
jgi:peptide/nickel transport system ATP-binding protein